MQRHSISLLTMAALIAIISTSGFAQRPADIECPAIFIISSAREVTDGDTLTFHVSFRHGNVDLSQIKYHWMVDRGKIVGGQGTPVIIVDTTGQGPAGSVTATLGTGGPYERLLLPDGF